MTKKAFFITTLLSFVFLKGYSTHLKGGEIYAESLSKSGYTYKIILFIYTDDHSPGASANGKINFGDGTGEFDIMDVIESSSTEHVQEGISRQTYVINYDYSTSGTYIISYTETTRTDAVNNRNTTDTPFFIESKIIIDPFLGSNKSPELTAIPNFKGIVGSSYIENPMAVDADEDSLAFKLAVPLQDLDAEIEDYQFPHLITGPNGAAANEDGTGKPDFTIDVVTGDVIWDAPVITGNYLIAYVIEEWRNINGEWYSLGYTKRDYLLKVEEVENQRPFLTIPKDTTIKAGEILTATIRGNDPDDDEVTIETTGAPYSIATLPAEYSQHGNEINFSWQTDTGHISNQPYEVVFRIFDHPENGPVLYDYKVWKVTVSMVALIFGENEKGYLKIYPNPSSGIVKVYSTLKNKSPVRISIYDLSGKTIYDNEFTAFSNLDLDLTLNSKDLYIIKFQNDNLIQSKKLILIE